MRTYLTEAKPQCWRAVAVFADGSERLLYLGQSSSKIREGYRAAFNHVLDEEERESVTGIALQRWHGAADAGRWLVQTQLTMPNAQKLVKVAA